uniref:UBX domain protein 11 n=1 Tax=Leptobrachium leishanense TaxID=445787 RepID=A0A8C5M4X1_9ANUR
MHTISLECKQCHTCAKPAVLCCFDLETPHRKQTLPGNGLETIWRYRKCTMSGPLVTLGKPRKTGLIPVNRRQYGVGVETSPDTWMHTGGKMSDGQIFTGKHTTDVKLPGTGRRAAPFKEHHAYTEDQLTEKGSTTFVGKGLRGKSLSICMVERLYFGQMFFFLIFLDNDGWVCAVQLIVLSGSVPSDFDLLSATMKRIGELERCIHVQECTLQKKDQEIATLEDKIKRLQRPKTENPVQVNQDLEMKCQKLQQRVNEMEQFLSDYGLEWVGDEDSSVAPQQRTMTRIQGHLSTIFKPDFDLLLQNLQDLNILGGEGKSHIEHRQGGARLRSPKPVPLTLFNNGIIMFNGPFRSYKEPSTQITDQRNVVFRERRFWDELPGLGQTVGSTQSTTEGTSEVSGPPLSVDQFLNKLPMSVVRGGQIVEIRGPIREALQESPTESLKLKEIKVDSPLVGMNIKRSEQSTAVSTLRIKSENREYTYKVRMLQSETLGDLRSYLSEYRDSLSTYEIISPFPLRLYEDDSCTLQELGLVPSAFLLLRSKALKTPGGQNTPQTSAYSQI